jgi:hypothetical protein
MNMDMDMAMEIMDIETWTSSPGNAAIGLVLAFNRGWQDLTTLMHFRTCATCGSLGLRESDGYSGAMD